MLHTTLLRYTHRAGIMIVDTGIITMIDTTDHEIGRTTIKQLVQMPASHSRPVYRYTTKPPHHRPCYDVASVAKE